MSDEESGEPVDSFGRDAANPEERSRSPSTPDQQRIPSTPSTQSTPSPRKMVNSPYVAKTSTDRDTFALESFIATASFSAHWSALSMGHSLELTAKESKTNKLLLDIHLHCTKAFTFWRLFDNIYVFLVTFNTSLKNVYAINEDDQLGQRVAFWKTYKKVQDDLTETFDESFQCILPASMFDIPFCVIHYYLQNLNGPLQFFADVQRTYKTFQKLDIIQFYSVTLPKPYTFDELGFIDETIEFPFDVSKEISNGKNTWFDPLLYCIWKQTPIGNLAVLGTAD